MISIGIKQTQAFENAGFNPDNFSNPELLYDWLLETKKIYFVVTPKLGKSKNYVWTGMVYVLGVSLAQYPITTEHLEREQSILDCINFIVDNLL